MSCLKLIALVSCRINRDKWISVNLAWNDWISTILFGTLDMIQCLDGTP